MEELATECEIKREHPAEITPAFWKSLFDITAEQVLMIDTKGRVLFTNKGFFGISSTESIGKSIFGLVPSSYSVILKNKLEEVNKVQSRVTFESVITVNSAFKYLELTIDPVYDSEEVLLGYSLASIDTTEIKQTQRKYNYKSNLEKLFLNISTKFINLPSKDINEGITESLELISRFTNSEHAYIVLFDGETSHIGYEWHSSFRSMVPFCSLETVQQLLKTSVQQLYNTDPVLIKPQDPTFGLNNDCPIVVNPMVLEGKRYGALVLVGKMNAEEDWSLDFAKPMMMFSNVFINTVERQKNALEEEGRKVVLEKAIKQRTIAIELQKDKLVHQSKELAEAELLVRQANIKLKDANSELEMKVTERTSSLEKSNQELDRFVYSVSHDIKAPLSSVQGLINLIRMSPPEELDYHLELMEKSIHKLNGFVEDILTHSRNSRVELKKDVINFEREVKLAADDLRHMDNASEVKLITSYNQRGKGVTDQYRLQSVLKNLISNAVKYYNPEAKRSWVKVVVETTRERIRINVSDNGIGIGADKVDNIFDMFYRASETSSGSGLGLYIVKETVEKLGGTITVASKEQVGTTLSLNIPNLA